MKNDEFFCDCDVIHADVVQDVKNRMPDISELYELSDFFKVISDNTRLKIMWALDEHEMCVCDLAVLLNMTKSAISHQLRTLREANLVKNRRREDSILLSCRRPCVPDIRNRSCTYKREKIRGVNAVFSGFIHLKKHNALIDVAFVLVYFIFITV